MARIGDPSFRNRLIHALQQRVNESRSGMQNRLANVILVNIDEQLVQAWAHLSDMGLSKTDMNAIRRIIKRRL